MRSMVTLEHDGGEVQSQSSRATVSAVLPLSLPISSRRERLHLHMLTAAGKVKNQ